MKPKVGFTPPKESTGLGSKDVAHPPPVNPVASPKPTIPASKPPKAKEDRK